MNTNGTYLKQLRRNCGMSLKDVYTRCGISDSKLSRIERNEGVPLSAPELRSLATLYGIEIVQLYLALGYLEPQDLNAYSLVFQDAEYLTDEEVQHVQEQINLFTRGRNDQ